MCDLKSPAFLDRLDEWSTRDDVDGESKVERGWVSRSDEREGTFVEEGDHSPSSP